MSQIDPRGPQFTAAITAVILATILWTAPSPLAISLLVVQAVLFAWGAALGVQTTPIAWVFRTWVRPRLAPPAHTEDAAPPRFAQAVGFTFAAIALIAFLLGAEIVGLVAVGLALAAAVLNAVFGFCLGCEIYLLAKRFTKPADKVATPA